MKAIKVTTDNVISMIDVAKNGEQLYKIIRNVIGGYMENTYPPRLPEDYVMIVNEEGKLHGLPINSIGCYLYESERHGDVIVGNVVILKLGTYQGERDVVGIPDDEANEIMNQLFSNLKGANKND